jgi:class 3 adenylate cyclase
VNIAARLCSEAGPGEILVSESLRKALANPPGLAALEPLSLRGKAQAVPVYRVDWQDTDNTQEQTPQTPPDR